MSRALQARVLLDVTAAKSLLLVKARQIWSLTREDSVILSTSSFGRLSNALVAVIVRVSGQMVG